MENFVVSARKYRPSTFNTVVGQHSITSTLKNAIRNNQLAQAFLFCGPRGVGKTTCARILAKTINCFSKTPDGEACNECESCTSFNSGQSLNVYELDAASNNSVDDIRTLIEQVRFAPQLGKFKVYIIDEVHMLSQAAFNAFLKTLEEPPAHAIFILATTEKHKILPTILSRCQKFDFNRITVDDMSKHLAGIAEKEHIKAEPEALHVIATKADGGLRDALSMFDQLVSFSGGHSLDYKSVIENLHILDYDYYFKIGDCILTSNIPSGLILFNEILSNGFDGQHFILGLAEHLRNLLVCKDPQTVKLLEVSENIRQKYLEQSAKFPVPILLQSIGLCTKTDIQYKGSKNQRLLVEFTLMQLCSVFSQPPADQKKNDLIIPVIKNPNQPATAPTALPTASGNHALPNLSAQKPNEKFSQNIRIQPHPDAPSIEIEKGVPKPINRAISTGISINSILNPQKKEEIRTAQQQDLPETDFSEKQLQLLWEEYAEKIQLQKRLSLYNTLSIRKPLVKSKTEIVFEVSNKIQQHEIEDEKMNLMQFLKNRLNNYSVQLTVVINEQSAVTKAYTPTDKFNQMSQKNPLLLKLKQSLDLDLEF